MAVGIALAAMILVSWFCYKLAFSTR